MPKVHQVKAGKDYPEAGIKKGDTYYWWQNYRGPVKRSLTRPKRQQLTNDQHLIDAYDIDDEIKNANAESLSALEEMRDDWVNRIESIMEDVDSVRSNLPEQFQENGPVAERLQEKYDTLESWKSELENMDFESEEEREDYESDEAYEQALEDEVESKLSEMQEHTFDL